MELTITIPEHLADRVMVWAELMQQNVPEMVETALDVALPPLPDSYTPVSALSDEELVALARVQMDAESREQLNQLQRKQRDGLLTDEEKQALLKLMQQYNLLWVRQSQAIAVAVERGLLPPLSS